VGLHLYGLPTVLTFNSTVVRVQLLSELEEIIAYKKNADQPDMQQMMRKTWVNR
jgi:serine/threonine-protein kinase mTOR